MLGRKDVRVWSPKSLKPNAALTSLCDLGLLNPFNKNLLTTSHGAGVHVGKGYFGDKYKRVLSLQEFVVEGGDRWGKTKITTASRQVFPHSLEPIFHTALKYCFKMNTGLNHLPAWSPCMAPLYPPEKRPPGSGRPQASLPYRADAILPWRPLTSAGLRSEPARPTRIWLVSVEEGLSMRDLASPTIPPLTGCGLQKVSLLAAARSPFYWGLTDVE